MATACLYGVDAGLFLEVRLLANVVLSGESELSTGPRRELSLGIVRPTISEGFVNEFIPDKVRRMRKERTKARSMIWQ